MSTGPVAAATVIGASFPAPQTSIALPENGGRFQNCEISGNSLHDLCRERCIVESVPKGGTPFPQGIAVVSPIAHESRNVFEPPGIPRHVKLAIWAAFTPVTFFWLRCGFLILASPQICLRYVPCQEKTDRSDLPWLQPKWYIE
jgi:hypothetical protein